MKKTRLKTLAKDPSYNLSICRNGYAVCGNVAIKGDWKLKKTYNIEKELFLGLISGMDAEITISDSNGLAVNGLPYSYGIVKANDDYIVDKTEPFAIFDGSDLKDALKVIRPIIKNSGSDIKILQYAHFECNGFQTVAIGCDGYRMVKQMIGNRKIGSPFELNLDRKTCEILYSLLGKGDVKVGDGIIWSEDFSVKYKNPVDDYIDWQKIFFTKYEDFCLVPKADLVKAVRTIKPMCRKGKDYNGVWIRFRKDGLELSPRGMDTRISVPYIYGYGPKEMTEHLLNPSYLFDYLTGVSRYLDKVSIHKSGVLKPMKFTDDFMILPKRVN